jgi:hypothetical protein
VEPADGEGVFLPEWQVQRHIGGRPGGHRPRLRGPLERAGGRLDDDLHRVPVMFVTWAWIAVVPGGTGSSTSAHAAARTDKTTPRVTGRSIPASSHAG